MSIPIHYSTQKDAYASADEWPTVSAQTHWRAPGASGMDGMPAHTHLDITAPILGEAFTGVLTVKFKVVLFMVVGKVSSVTGRWSPTVTLDGGATFPLIGDPMGVRSWTGTLTYDLSAHLSSIPRRGFFPLFATVYTNFTNHDRTVTGIRFPVYSNLDPTAPESPQGDGTGNRWQASAQVTDANQPLPTVERWGSQITEFLQTLPLLGPLSPETPWRLQAHTYNYGVNAGLLPAGTLELRVDPDFHNGLPGDVVDTVSGFTIVHSYYLPGPVPDGTHKLMVRWMKPNFDGSKELDSLLVFNVNVGPGGAVQPPNYPGFVYGKETP